jgi:hypothetical protein
MENKLSRQHKRIINKNKKRNGKKWEDRAKINRKRLRGRKGKGNQKIKRIIKWKRKRRDRSREYGNK